MNKTQIIAITVMTVVTAVMFAGPIALNAFAKPIVIHPCIPHPHHPCLPPVISSVKNIVFLHVAYYTATHHTSYVPVSNNLGII